MPKPTAKRFALIRDHVVLSYVNAPSPKAAEREREKRFPGQADVVVKPAWIGARDHYSTHLAGYQISHRKLGAITEQREGYEWVRADDGEVIILNGGQRTGLTGGTRVVLEYVSTPSRGMWTARKLYKGDCQKCGALLDSSRLGCGDCQMGYTS